MRIPSSFTLACLIALSLLGGCAPTVWNKPGATQQDFASDKYSCERDSRQSGGFGTGLAGAIEVQEFFNRCLVAHGWEAQGNTPSPRQAAAVESQNWNELSRQNLKSCVSGVREKQEYQPILSNLNDNNTGRFTMGQLSDTRRLTIKESSILVLYAQDISECQDIYVKSLEKSDAKVAQIFRQGFSEVRIVRARAVRRETSWGDQNSQLQEITDKMVARLKAPS